MSTTKQDQYINKNLKSVLALLFIPHPSPLKCIILSQNELTNLGHSLPRGAWVTTTQHHVLIGHAPENILEDKAYLNIIEQICFFNGDTLLLQSSMNTLSWIKEETKEKLHYLSDVLAPIRHLPVSALHQFKNLLNLHSHSQRFFSTDEKVNQAPQTTQPRKSK